MELPDLTKEAGGTRKKEMTMYLIGPDDIVKVSESEGAKQGKTHTDILTCQSGEAAVLRSFARLLGYGILPNHPTYVIHCLGHRQSREEN